MINPVPFLPETAPFTPEQRAYLNGLFAGMFNRSPIGNAGGDGAIAVKLKILIGYGSQSGNAETFSKKYAKRLTGLGFDASSASLEEINVAKIKAADALLLLTSTWGEGDFPDNAVAFWNALNAGDFDTVLAGKSYSVLALGDKNYADTYCLAGRKLDEKLAALGINRIAERVECDVDFAGPAAEWEKAVNKALGTLKPAGASGDAPVAAVSVTTGKPEGYGKKNPFPAALKRNDLLNAPSAAKDTRHVVFDLTDSGLSYEAGDALGVMPKNCPGVVDNLISAGGFDPQVIVETPSGGQLPLRQALIECYEVRQFLAKPPTKGSNVIDFVETLKPLQPRLYSISSSPKAHPGEVHLTVGIVRYEQYGIQHKGVASSFLADRLALEEKTGVFVHTSPHFRLPVDDDVPVIMVGPGTGIAPFRAFLEEREARGAKGKNWLFFGDQRKSENFLYRTQVEGWEKSGLLTHVALAFSRDQKQKIYVQDRMREKSAVLWSWFEQGAHFYVCGDASRMAKDVQDTLLEIFSQNGADPKAYLQKLKDEKRYLRDVY